MEQSIKNLFEKFGIFQNLRVTKKQKIRFLGTIVQYFDELGYQTVLLKKKFQVKNSFIGVMGNLDKIETLIVTHYDTPMTDMVMKKHIAFDDAHLKKKNSLNLLLTVLTLLAVIIGLNLFVFYKVFNDAVFNGWDLFGIGLNSCLLFILIKTSQIGGTPQFNNLNRNTSSIVSILKFAEKNVANKKIGYGFVDYGCSDHFGYLVLNEYIKNSKIKKVIFLDSVGFGKVEVSESQPTLLNDLHGKHVYIFGTSKKNEITYTDKNIAVVTELLSEYV